MTQNVGIMDRNVRFALGGLLILVALAGFAGVLPGVAGATALSVAVGSLVVGAVLTITAYRRTCLLYGVLGVNTMGSKTDEESADGATVDADPAVETDATADLTEDEFDVGRSRNVQ